MTKNRFLLGVLVIACAVSMSFARNYAFPSPLPSNASTEGFNLDTVKQIVSFIWDDNSYSGLVATNYETAPGQTFGENSWVGGKMPWGASAKNELGIQPGDFGMSWAITKLAGRDMPVPEWKADVTYTAGMQCEYNGQIWEAKYWVSGTAPAEGDNPFKLIGPAVENLLKKNPDNSPVAMTFNVITGLFVPLIGATDGNRVSKFGDYPITALDVQEFPHLQIYFAAGQKIARVWGREQMILANASATGNVNGEIYGQINEVFKMTKKFGHEIGNHTIDHMETNSVLPNNNLGFGRWGGEGFAANMIETIEYGDVSITVNESEAFGRRAGISWHSMGWKSYVGKALSINGWEGLIKLGDEELNIALGLSVAAGTGVSFRAPRLEINSNMFWALKNLNYLYDCGNEEGYEYNMNGTNYLWPYTTDNGSPNVAWQRMAGENKTNFDSLPQGLWQFPVSVLIVPEEGGHRERVWNSYADISAVDKRPQTKEDKDHFMKNGKITGFDFNLFILYGADKAASIATMRYSLDQRMNGGKSPMQIGCHTDYFTPMYDYGTLMVDNTYKVALKYNTWQDRKAVFEDIVDYGIPKGAYFWDGRKAIEYVKTLSASAKVGAAEKNITDISDWKFFTGNNKSSVSGDVNGATITTAKLGKDEWEQTGFEIYGEKGEFEFDHISLSYSTSAPLTIRLITEEPIDATYPYEVTLNNLNGWGASVANTNYWAKSGQIPLSAFQRNQYVGDENPGLIGLKPAGGTEFTKKIIGIEVSVQVPEGKEQTTKLAIKDFKLHSGNQIIVGIAGQKGPKMVMQKIAVLGMNNNALKLNLIQKGLYNVDIVSVNGRLVQSFKDVNLNAGVNTLPLNKLSSGMYMIRIHNKQVNTTLKSLVM